jgi:hypothetical protein
MAISGRVDRVRTKRAGLATRPIDASYKLNVAPHLRFTTKKGPQNVPVAHNQEFISSQEGLVTILSRNDFLLSLHHSLHTGSSYLASPINSLRAGQEDKSYKVRCDACPLPRVSSWHLAASSCQNPKSRPGSRLVFFFLLFRRRVSSQRCTRVRHRQRHSSMTPAVAGLIHRVRLR